MVKSEVWRNPRSTVIKLWQSWTKKGFSRLLATYLLPQLWHTGYAVLLYGFAVAAALTVIGLNLGSYFVGKELQGAINQDGTKMLALQVAAKIHELLMLASLSKILWSLLLDLIILHSGMPFSALTVGDRFSNIAYLWSPEFFRTALASFQRKSPFMLIATICTILGVIVGPSSATAMAPNFDEWPADQISIPLNMSRNDLWPTVLDQNTLPNKNCTDLWLDCGNQRAWTSLKDNLFSYWGQETFYNIKGAPEAVNVPASQSVRTMSVRFRGPFSLYQPLYSAVTVQSVWAANMVNNLRLLWFSDNDKKCDGRRGRFCSYEDIKWFINTLQPNVRTSCNPVNDQDAVLFPTMSSGIQSLAPTDGFQSEPLPKNSSVSKLQWLTLAGSVFSQVSAGVLVDLQQGNQYDDARSFACSVIADWANSSTSSSFLGSPFMVDGQPPYFFNPEAEGSNYVGSLIRIEPEWANTVNEFIGIGSNSTAFDSLYLSGDYPTDLYDAKSKTEAILSVLVAEGMSWIGADTGLSPGYSQTDMSSVNWTSLATLNASTSDERVLFRTNVVGYGYGLHTATGVSAGRIFSVLTLIIFCVVVVGHLTVQVVRMSRPVNACEDTLEMIAIALRSSTIHAKSDTDHEGETASLVPRKNVRIVMFRGEPEMELASLDEGEDVPLSSI